MISLWAMRLIAVLVPLAWVAPAVAQVESREGIALQNQILDLRRQIQNLQDQSNRGGANSPTNLGRSAYPTAAAGTGSDLVAQLLSRVDALEEQVRQLRGRTDETQNELQRQGADLGKRIDDLAFERQNTRGAMPQAPTAPQSANLALTPPSTSLGAPPAAVPVPQPAAPVRRTPEMAIQEASAALARRDYPGAEQAAREVLSSSRTSPRAYDAQFLLAQALMGQRQFSQAAIAYDDTYNRSRKGAHAPDALLGLANSLVAINEKKAACDTLTKLHTEYPSPRPDIREGMAASSQRANCK